MKQVAVANLVSSNRSLFFCPVPIPLTVLHRLLSTDWSADYRSGWITAGWAIIGARARTHPAALTQGVLVDVFQSVLKDNACNEIGKETRELATVRRRP